jgi:hypothetical protein
MVGAAVAATAVVRALAVAARPKALNESRCPPKGAKREPERQDERGCGPFGSDYGFPKSGF